MTSFTALLGSGLRSVRAMGLAIAVAGVAVIGLTSGAPAAHAPSAAGPDAIVPLDHGVVPVFFCDPGKPHQHHKTAKHPFKCTDPDGPRF